MTIPAVNDFRVIDSLVERLNAGATHPSFSPHAMRHYVRNSATNGLAPHVRRLGRKILVSESGFLAWLDSKTPKANGKQARP
jgi:hypothetical protein